MNVAIDVPEVAECTARQCAFNRDGTCHAQAITIGDTAVQPICDTFLVSTLHNHRAAKAGVGACKATQCRHNDDLACRADAIHIMVHTDHAECETFSHR